MTVDDDTLHPSDQPQRDSRPWHLPLKAPLDRDRVVRLSQRSDVEHTTDDSSAATVALDPLWLRIVTGKSFAWRLRRLRRVALRVRSRLAHAVLRLPSQVRRLRHSWALDGRRWLTALRENPRRRSRRTWRPSRPVVETNIGVDRLPRSHPLRTQVSLVPLAGPDASTWPTPGHVEPIGDGCVRGVDPSGEPSTPRIGPVLIARVNPSGFPQALGDEVLRLQQVLRAAPTSGTNWLAPLRRARAVQCVVPPNADPVSAATVIAQAAASGVPLTRGSVPDDVRALLPADLMALIDRVGSDALVGPWQRERHSINLRRIALASLSPRGTWSRLAGDLRAPIRSTPHVSVLLASNRASDVVEASRQVSEQRGVDVQLVVGLHGSHMTDGVEDAIRAVSSGQVVIERYPGSWNLGEVLRALTERADGELVAKWDDDDWYGPYHLSDLVVAREYSGAPLVGKAAEFVYLAALDVTIRRFALGAERWSTTVAGGTLLLSAADLRSVGWSPVPRQVDRHLIDNMARHGLGCYRTHGFGYVLRRRGDELGGHTWQATDGYFLSQAHDQRPGLDLGFAGVRDAA